MGEGRGWAGGTLLFSSSRLQTLNETVFLNELMVVVGFFVFSFCIVLVS